MFRRAVVPGAIIVATLCLTVVIGNAVEPLLKLALQRADMPATLQKATFPYPETVEPSSLKPFGVGGLEAVHYVYKWLAGGTLNTPIGSIDKEWLLEGEVFRAPDEGGAKRLFALGKAANIGHFSSSDFAGEMKALNLPPYGDEQIARVGTDISNGLGMMVFVRKGAVVWQVRVAAIPIQFRATEAQMLTVLETYAARQQARVDGSGNRP